MWGGGGLGGIDVLVKGVLVRSNSSGSKARSAVRCNFAEVEIGASEVIPYGLP